jgi:hypothetical protein
MAHVLPPPLATAGIKREREEKKMAQIELSIAEWERGFRGRGTFCSPPIPGGEWGS